MPTKRRKTKTPTAPPIAQPKSYREEYVERVRRALTIQGKEILEFEDDDYLEALDEIAEEVRSMIEAKRSEMEEDES